MSKNRTFTMGDIHGNAKGLKILLDSVDFDYENDTLIQLGDVADGWSETSESVDILLEIKNLISIRGNHDVWVYDWFLNGDQPMIWTQQGGKATIDSYIRTSKLKDPKHKEFWLNQKDWYIDEQNRLFIHAGWDYKMKPVELEVGKVSDRTLFELQAGYPVNAGTVAKECHWDRTLIKNLSAIPIFEAKGMFDYNKKVKKAVAQFNEVYIGHTAEIDHTVHLYENVWNMDSGSGWHGRLSIMDIDTKEITYAEYSKDLYPNEKGR